MSDELLELLELLTKVSDKFDTVIEQNEEIIEKLANLSTPGSDYGYQQE